MSSSDALSEPRMSELRPAPGAGSRGSSVLHGLELVGKLGFLFAFFFFFYRIQFLYYIYVQEPQNNRAQFRSETCCSVYGGSFRPLTSTFLSGCDFS